MNTHALVFDIETVADLTPETRDAVTALAQHRDMTPEHFGALCPPLARVACLAWYDLATNALGACFDASLHQGQAPAALEVPDGRTGSVGTLPCVLEACASERELLQRFGSRIEQHLQHPNAQLVTFNGRGFDLPVLVHRAIKHGVTEGRALLTKAANENRYHPRLHVDLMDVVTFAGAGSRWPLAAYAIGYGYASPKQDMDGAQVGPAIEAGRILDVVRYCAGDVLATAHVYRCVLGTTDGAR